MSDGGRVALPASLARLADLASAAAAGAMAQECVAFLRRNVRGPLLQAFGRLVRDAAGRYQRGRNPRACGGDESRCSSLRTVLNTFCTKSQCIACCICDSCRFAICAFAARGAHAAGAWSDALPADMTAAVFKDAVDEVRKRLSGGSGGGGGAARCERSLRRIGGSGSGGGGAGAPRYDGAYPV
jgi:hypothetical protein